MGLFGKIKQALGIGTVSVKISSSPTFNTSETELKGSVTIIGKSDQIIESVEIDFEEEFTSGTGDNEKTTEITLGKTKLAGFTIKTGETKTVEFTLPYSYGKSSSESMAEKGGVVGGIGKVSGFLKGEKSKFWLTATVDVKGAKIDPNDTMELKKSK